MQYPKATLTLFLYIALSLILSANASQPIQRRGHANLNRILRKRAPQTGNEEPSGIQLVPLVGPGANPTPAAETTTTPVTTETPTTTSDTATATETTTDGGIIGSIVDPVTSVIPSLVSVPVSESSIVAPSSSVVVSSVAPVTTSASLPATTTQPTTEAAPQLSTSVVKGGSTVTKAVNAAESSSPPVAQSAASQNKSKTLTILIAVAASIGGIIILWTIFRKWKLSRSSKSDNRMQPIDWQPTNAEDDIPGATRRMSGGSFRSAYSHSEYSHGNGNGYGATSDSGHGNRLGALPDHDFTAGSAHLAPVGGYADLSRGPSPQPQMDSLTRGPSFTQPNQFDNSVPLHHQAAGGYGGRY